MAVIAGNFLHFLILDVAQEIIQRRQIASNNRALRDSTNPLSISDLKFRKIYHMPKILVLEVLMPLIEPHIVQHGRRATFIPLHLKVLAALHLLAQGSYQGSLGSDSNVAMSQPSASRAIKEIIEILGLHVFPNIVKFPTQPEEKLDIKRKFMEKHQFPNVLGAIDCTHVAIICPPINDDDNPGIAYLNRKGFYSINVQAVCDSRMKLLAVNARYPGSVHDAAIWNTSNINAYLRRCFEQGDQESWLLGDSGYPLSPWLMTPIPDAAENTAEWRYTKKHCSTRIVIERCFGSLKQKFRSLLRHRVLHYGHRMSGLIIYSAAVLHNICVDHNYMEEFENFDLDDDYNDRYNMEMNIRNFEFREDMLTTGRHIRNILIRRLDE